MSNPLSEAEHRERERKRKQQELDKLNRDALRDWMNEEGGAPEDIPARDALQRVSDSVAEEMQARILQDVLANSHAEMKRRMREASGDE